MPFSGKITSEVSVLPRSRLGQVFIGGIPPQIEGCRIEEIDDVLDAGGELLDAIDHVPDVLRVLGPVGAFLEDPVLEESADPAEVGLQFDDMADVYLVDGGSGSALHADGAEVAGDGESSQFGVLGDLLQLVGIEAEMYRVITLSFVALHYGLL